MTRCTRLRKPAWPGHASGFTLIELLVVLTIVAVLAGIATLSIDLADNHQRAEDEASRLAELIRLQCEESVLLGRELGLRFEPAGYRFVQYSDLQWQDRLETRLYQPRQLPDGFHFELSLGQRLVVLDEQPESEPHIICFGSGEMTPFELLLATPDTVDGLKVLGHFDGSIELQAWADE